MQTREWFCYDLCDFSALGSHLPQCGYIEEDPLSDTEAYTPSVKQVRDDFSTLYDRDPKIIRARRTQFDRWLAQVKDEAREEIIKNVLHALHGPLYSDPPVRFPAGVYLEEAERAGGRSEWAMRYAEEARAHVGEQKSLDSIHQAINKALGGVA